MRKFFSLFAVAVTSFAMMMSCEQESNNDVKPVGGDFAFGEPTVTSSTIEVNVTPSDTEADYHAAIIPSADVADKSDTEIAEMIAKDAKTYKGVQTVKATDLTAQTEYELIAFFVATPDKITRLNMTTSEAEAPIDPELFDIQIEVKDITATSATAIATPNSNGNRYYFRVITKLELDAFGIYDDDYQIFEYILENPNSSEWITQGTTTLNCRLAAETDYLAVAFNFENWEAMHEQTDELKLFRYAFKTPEGEPVDPDSMFITANLTTTSTNFSLDVSPVKDEQWTYYIWKKESYDETLANEPKANIVMRSYFGLNNIAVEQGYSFGDIIQTDKLGKVGSQQISAYEPLKNATDYVVVLFYVDPTVDDPTEVYDYNYVAVEFSTSDSVAPAPALGVSEPVIVAEGFSYTINFVVETDSNAADLLVGAQLWANYDFEKYWDPNDWSQIQAFFMFRKSVGAETLAAAKDGGATISFTGFDKNDYVFFFEALNAENKPTQYAVKVTADMFDNAQ